MKTDEAVKKKTDFLVLTRLATLEKMDLDRLRKEWELYHNGEKAPKYGKQFLLRKLAWRLQEMYYGGLDPKLSERLLEIAKYDTKNRLNHQKSKDGTKAKVRTILPGTRFVRIWRDQRIEVVTTAEGFEYEGEHDAIIDQSLWDKAHAILMHNHANPGDAKRIKMSSALCGVIRCGHCNAAMGTSFSNKTKNKRYVYYICTKDAKRAISTCPIQRIPANDIEQAVITQLSEVFKKPGVISGIFQEMNFMAEREIERFTRQREGLIKTQSKIQDTPNSQNELARIAEDIYKVERQIKHASRNDISEEDVARSFQTMDIFWESLFPIEQRRMIELLVELVEIRETGLDLVLKTSGIESLIKDLAGIAHDVKQRGTLK